MWQKQTVLALLIAADAATAGAQSILEKPPFEREPTSLTVSDPARIAVYAAEIEGQSDLFLVHHDSGAELRLTSTDWNESRPSLSTDGRYLLYASNRDKGTLWLMELPSGASRRQSQPNEVITSFSLSPDGSQFAFSGGAAGNRDIWIQDTRTGKRRQATSHPDDEWSPHWSPSGDHVVFYATWDKTMTDVKLVELETGAVRTLAHHPAEDYAPVFSPDGSRIAFVSRRAGPISDVWSVDISSGLVRRVTNGVDVIWLYGWSRNYGIAFCQLVSERRQLVRVSKATGDVETIDEGVGFYLDPAVSPSDGRIAVSSLGERPERTTVILDSSYQVLNSFGFGLTLQYKPQFSPDGQRVAQVISLGGWRDSNDLWTHRSDGTDARQVTSSGYVTEGIWCGGPGNMVYSARADGFGPTRLLRISERGGEAEILIDNGRNIAASDCHPDGRRVVITEDSEDGTVVFLFDPDTGEREHLVPQMEGAEGFRYIMGATQGVFLSRDNEEDWPEIYLTVFDGAEPRRLTMDERAKSWPAPTPQGDWIYYTTWVGESRFRLLNVTD